MNLFQPLFSVLPRSRASVMLLAAAVVMATVATTLVAAVPLYSDAIIEAGLRSTLEEAAPSDAGLEASFRDEAAAWGEHVDALADTGARRLPGELDTVTVAVSDAYSIASGVDVEIGDGWITSIATVASDRPLYDAVADGAQPARTIGAQLHVDAAELLGLAVGDVVTVARDDATVDLLIESLIEPVDPVDRRWFDQLRFRDGVIANGSFTEIGPLFVDAADFERTVGTATYRWRVLPEAGSITTAELDQLRRGAERMVVALGDRLEVTNLAVDTGLPALLGATDTAIGSTGAVIAAILLQLVGVALYGVGLSASVLTSSRAVETSMLRSRGATAEQLATMAAVEAVLIAIPAVALGPWLGGVVVEVLERWGPVSVTGLDLEPRGSNLATFGAVLVGVAVVAIVTYPAFRSARGFATSQFARTRQEGPLAFQRAGLDVGLVALSLIGLWQLTRSTAATRDLSGRLGTDPVLVLAPALGVVAASLITLRMIAFVAHGAQDVTAAHGALSPALAGWELARRPGRTARTSVLVVLSVTVGTFAAVHGASWEQSQRDQADAMVGTDARYTPDPTPSAVIASPFVGAAVRGVPGVDAALPLGRPDALILGETVPAVVTDVERLEGTLRVREDLFGDVDAASFAELHDPPSVGGVDLGAPEGPLRISYTLDARPSSARGSIRAAAMVIDGDGTPVRLLAEPVPIDEPTGELSFPLATDIATGERLSLTGPLTLIELTIAIPSVQDVAITDAPRRPGEFDLTLASASIGDRPVDLGRSWQIGGTRLGNVLSLPSVELTIDAGAITLDLDSGSTQEARAVYEVEVATGAFGVGRSVDVPIVVTAGLAASTQLDVGDTITGRLAGSTQNMRIAAVVDRVPFAPDLPVALLADWETLATQRYVQSQRIERPEEWALVLDPTADASAVERTLAAPPFDSVEFVERAQLARRIAREPVTVGLSGSLALALAASLLIAVVGLVLTAVVGGRERRPSFAVLRAMGTRASELRRWLLFETVPLVGLSALAGLIAGIALARLALPSLSVTPEGERAVPEAVLVLPWATLSAILAIAIAAGMALPVVTARLLRRHRTADELRIGETT